MNDRPLSRRNEKISARYILAVRNRGSELYDKIKPDGNVKFMLHLLNEFCDFVRRLKRTDDYDFSQTGNFDASLDGKVVSSLERSGSYVTTPIMLRW